MKNLLLLVVMISVLTITAGTTARAQVADTIVADIPFGFTVRDTTLPAGRYTIRRVDSVSPGVMMISGVDNHDPVVFLVGTGRSIKEPDETKLIFDRVGDQYFLSEIFVIGNSDGVELKKSRAERKLEKEGAAAQMHSVVLPAQTGTAARR